jgi:hypothetical protein
MLVTLQKILLWRLMFFTSRQYRYVRHIVTIWLWPTMFNHCQPWSTIVNHGHGQSSHCQYDYGQPLSTMVNGHGQYRCVRHIVTIWIWPTMFNHSQPCSTIVNHGHGQSRSTIFMFVTL